MITLDLPVKAEKLMSGFARQERVSVATWARKRLLESLEDEADYRVAKKRWEDVEAGRSQLHSAEEVERAVGLRV
jgi:predicted DNA-binding protein